MKQWFIDHSISTHSLVAFFGMFTAFLAANEQARTIVLAFLNKHPFYSLAFGFATFASTTYKGSHSAQGVAKLAADNDAAQLKQSAEKANQ